MRQEELTHLSERTSPHPNQLDMTFDAVPTLGHQLSLQLQAEAKALLQSRSELEADILWQIVAATGVEPPLIQQIVGMALASLHKESLLSEQDIYGMLLKCSQAFGTEACYHLNGILRQGLLQQEHVESLAEGWFETVTRYCPREEWEPLSYQVEGWLAERSAERKEDDQYGEKEKNREEEVWEQELEALTHHPDVDGNGRIFLANLRNRPQLARGLIGAGRLLEETMERQRAASAYTEHQVLELHQDPNIAQMEAEQEFLLIPNAKTAPNLLNWDMQERSEQQ